MAQERKIRTKKLPQVLVNLATIFVSRLKQGIKIPFVLVGIFLFYIFGINAIWQLAPDQYVFVFLLLVGECFGFVIGREAVLLVGRWFFDRLEQENKRYRSNQTKKGKYNRWLARVKYWWRFVFVVSSVLALILGSATQRMVAFYSIEAIDGWLLVPYFFFWFLTLFESLLLWHQRKTRVLASIFLISSLTKVASVFALNKKISAVEAVLFSFPISSIIAWLFTLFVGRTFAYDQAKEESLLARVRPQVSDSHLADAPYYFWRQWRLLPLLFFAPLATAIFFSPSQAGRYAAFIWLGWLPFMVAACFWSLGLAKKSSTCTSPIWSLSVIASGIGASFYLIKVEPTLFFNHFTADEAYLISYLPFVLLGSNCLAIVYIIQSFCQGSKEVYQWLLGTGGTLMLLALLIFHSSLLTILLVSTTILTLLLLASVTVALFEIDQQVIGRNFRDVKMFLGGQDLPPVDNRLGKLRVLLLSRGDIDERRLKALHLALVKWRRKGYHILLLCGNDRYGKPCTLAKNLTVIRRGGCFTIYFFTLLYSLFCFHDQFDVVVSVESRLHLFSPLSLRLPVVYLRSAKRKRFQGIFTSLRRFFYGLHQWLDRKSSLITLTTGKITRLDLGMILKKYSDKLDQPASSTVLGGAYTRKRQFIRI